MRENKLLKFSDSLNPDGFILLYFQEEDVTIIVEKSGYFITDKNLMIDGKLTRNKKISFHIGIDKIKHFNFEPFIFEENKKLTDKITNRIFTEEWTK